MVMVASEWGFVDATPLSIVRRHELGRLQCMVGIAARRQGSFQLWLHTQSNAKQPSPSVLRPSHYSVESAKAGDGARCRAQLIGPSRVREPDAHRPERVPRCPPSTRRCSWAANVRLVGLWTDAQLDRAVHWPVCHSSVRSQADATRGGGEWGRCILLILLRATRGRCILGLRGSGARGRRAAAAPSRRGGSLADALPERA